MMTKYNFDIDNAVVKNNINRLINQTWKLIPMRENNENWISQLNTVLIEVVGLGELFSNNLSYLILVSKLEGLKAFELDFIDYRKTVFEAISLLKEMEV